MVRRLRFFAILLVAGLLFAAAAWGMTAKTYQVTGPVLEVTNDMIAVQKGKDRWEIARDPSTKVTGNLKVGDKVTVEYRMIATSVEIKPAAASKKKK